MDASPKIKKYFEETIEEVQNMYKLGQDCRSMGMDPSLDVDIKLAKNLAERVVGLISVVAPQIENTEVVPRIEELEEKYGKLDWRVAFTIALEVAQQKFCEFKNKKEAMEVGIRVGFAYVTVGVVSSPLEGFTDLDIKKTAKGEDYLCLNFAGPIRNAGGTSASVCVLIADYVRKQMGYAKYDATEAEINRCYREVYDYHERVTNLQYQPSKEELNFLVKNIPVEISGIASERIEVANFKDLPRVPTNLIRSGFCLVNSSCIPLKAPKLWKQLSKWGHDFEMQDWDFMEEFLHIQHESKAKKKTEDKESVSEEKVELPENIQEIVDYSSKVVKTDPIYTYVEDLVAGRPVFSHPLRSGGFRLRYGRSRASGYSAQGMSPATLSILDEFVTTATQFKVERPGKAASYTICDSIEGPTVLLNNGQVVQVESEKQGLALKDEVKEILYLGDVLINYGDFFDRAHPLLPAGYCEEWWAQELEREISDYLPEATYDEKLSKVAEILKININVLRDFLEKPLESKPSPQISTKLSEFFPKLPLHPKYTYFFSQVPFDDFVSALKFLQTFKFDDKMIIPYSESQAGQKRILELMGIPHFATENALVIEKGVAEILIKVLRLDTRELFEYARNIVEKERELVLDKRLDKFGGDENIFLINKFSTIKVKDKAGTFIGARMGRPEKAKMRKMQPPPHGLFPVGEEGGRLKTFQSATEKGTINAEFELWWDEKEGQESILPYNIKTGNMCVKKYWDNKNKIMLDEDEPESPWVRSSKWMKYDFKDHFDWCLKQMKTRVYPDLIKGMLGSASTDRSPENPMKAILRAKHDIAVNKDGTIRYDASEVPITHFKPKEVGTPIDKLKKLGYTHDIYNQPLTSEEQILEMIPQDVILPACEESPNEGCDKIFTRTANFVDDELEYLYKKEKYFNVKKPADLAGHYICVLAPHTSAGTVGRIVGFSKTQGLYAHPLMHAAIRRDCDGDEGGIFLLLDAFLNFSTKYLNNKLGATMDAPLVLTSILNPSEVDDMVFNIERSSKYGLDFYQATEEGKMPWDIKMTLVNDVLGTAEQYEGYAFTHTISDINEGVKCSAYKTLPSMKEKLDGQMALAEKIRASDTKAVARAVIEKHFIKDTRGNLRKFSQQKFRCTKCGEKYRRPPLSGKCFVCNHNSIIFTVTEGSVKKYVGYSMELAEKYDLAPYLQENLVLNAEAIDSLFGKETEKQEGLSSFF